jgi:hypothetical protein
LLRICLTLQNVLSIMREGDSLIFTRLQETLVSLIMIQSQSVGVAFHIEHYTGLVYK